MVNRTAATLPAEMTPFADARSVGVTHFSYVVVISSSMMPAACAIMGTVPPQAKTRISGVSSIAFFSVVLAFVIAGVVGVVEQLRSPHGANLRAQAHQRHREKVVGKAGIDACGEAGRFAKFTRFGDGRNPVRWVQMHPGQHPRRHRG